MDLPGLSLEEQILYSKITSNDLESIKMDLLTSEDTFEKAKILLLNLRNIISTMGKVWNEEHDLQGELQTEVESLTSNDIERFYANMNPVTEMIRSRFPIRRSEKAVAVGTLINIHAISELLELSLREKGYLTYYWGVELTTDKIKTHLDQNSANILVLSCMAVNTEFNCFDELRKLRETYPTLKIIVGGQAFQMFLVLKDDPENPALTKPYKEHNYYDKIKKANTLRDFVTHEFSVIYCETLDDIQQEIETNL